MKQRATLEPSQITVRAARPVSSNHAVRTDVNDRLALFRKDIEGCGDKRLVTLMVQVGNQCPVATEAHASDKNQLTDEVRRDKQTLTAAPPPTVRSGLRR
jgi:hypothetical protein